MALRVCHKYNSVLYSYIGWLIDELCTPSPPHPLAHPQTAPIGIGIGYRGGRWVRMRVCGGKEWRRARQSDNLPPYVGEEHRIILAANAQCHIHTLFILFSILSSLILWDECTTHVKMAAFVRMT